MSPITDGQRKAISFITRYTGRVLLLSEVSQKQASNFIGKYIEEAREAEKRIKGGK